MTGRDLILYILANNLENEPIIKDGKLVGFITVGEAAAKMGVGIPTIYTWMAQRRIKFVTIGNANYIPADFVLSDIQKERVKKQNGGFN